MLAIGETMSITKLHEHFSKTPPTRDQERILDCVQVFVCFGFVCRVSDNVMSQCRELRDPWTSESSQQFRLSSELAAKCLCLRFYWPLSL